jgi:UDP-N-acetylmuramoyl-L-alanyl-D-glutamate--2,6-diaminopimelate ligase
MERTLRECVAALEVLEYRGPESVSITDLAYDHRNVKPGSLFFALPGLHLDGHAFIGKAIESGASAVIHSAELADYAPGIAYVRVADPRVSMSPVANAFFGDPSSSLAVVGVTGTEGKSTTVYLAYQLFALAGKKAGFFSTVMSDVGQGEMPNPEHQTTPEATAVMRMLAQMRAAGVEYAVVEASSHGLSKRLNRLGDVRFDVGVMTNVTHEHLEFHGTLEQYASDKANLFRALDTHRHVKRLPGGEITVPSFGVANADDGRCAFFSEATRKRVLTFSASGGDADLSAEGVQADDRGCSFAIRERATGQRIQARIELPGAFNVGNALAALLVVSGTTGIPVAALAPLLPSLTPVRGRMTAIRVGQPFEVIVDYAHTPSSFKTIFPPLRGRAKGKIISLFGSGGERDVEKRPQQGRIAADHCDVVILSDEDPRGEDPMELLEMIAAGCPELPRGERLFLIPDRPTAIRKAFSLAKEGDMVLLLGKGHENSIIYSSGAIPYDEIREAEKALAEMGYGKEGGLA